MSPNKKLLRHQGGEPALRMLIKCAVHRSTITYENLGYFVADELHRKNREIWRHMGDLVGTLMDRIWEDYSPLVPPINLLVVSGNTGLPSCGADGHVSRYLRVTANAGVLTDEDSSLAVDSLMEEVWNYDNWRDIYQTLYGQNFEEPDVDDYSVDPEYKEPDGESRRGGYGGPAESEEHKALKTAVIANPMRAIGHDKIRFRKPEMRLKSGDEVDAYFDCESEIVCVEVKSSRSPDSDLERGIYQCVKYRAVARAQEELMPPLGRPRGVRAKLVYSGRIMPIELRRIAERLDIEVLRWSKTEFTGGDSVAIN